MGAQAAPAAPRQNRAVSARESRPAAVQGRRPFSPRTCCLLPTLADWAALHTAPTIALRPPPALAPDHPPLYCAGMVSYPQSGAGGRDELSHRGSPQSARAALAPSLLTNCVEAFRPAAQWLIFKRRGHTILHEHSRQPVSRCPPLYPAVVILTTAVRCSHMSSLPPWLYRCRGPQHSGMPQHPPCSEVPGTISHL